ncbi:MAG: aminopeptidase P family protein [Chlorobi bacterium]|nr:MAG: aminopeptidase P family protein [Bacteroidota bacterium]MBE2265209.1 aminopeptidase P family protein [Flavobacteriales bacterium]MBL1161480.1 aminopeptidase P family protein [Chlorobiota bacterium]MBW7854110.1 aminopeptidase P family protein [Candidatus Kapabacteria bacterium]MCC6330706.1 aminopeptidase P family protein [Ignavibacteria bacterium]
MSFILSPFHAHRIVWVVVFLVALTVADGAAHQHRFIIEDSDGIPAEVYAQRRQRLIDSLPDNSFAIILAADVRNRQNDVDYEYRQNSNLLYLTGFPFPNCALLLSKNPFFAGGLETRELFFVRPRNPQRELWSGITAGAAEAATHYGLQFTAPYSQLTTVLATLLGEETSTVAGNQHNHDRIAVELRSSPRPDSLYVDGWPTSVVGLPLLDSAVFPGIATIQMLHDRFGYLPVKTRIPALAAMREVKDTAELRLMRKAVGITIAGHEAVIRNATARMAEYELEALMEYTFKKMGAEDVGYPSIVGSSYNACVLHYTANRRTTLTGDLVLADCGAEYHGYTADITRTFPINGRFTPEQRAIYNIVLEAQDSGIAACMNGAPFKAPHNAAVRVITKGLKKLGIITTDDQVKQYFMHGTSHYLGLDVHDAGTGGPLKVNSIITVEPGIYIPEGADCDPKWWNIGVRIEDDILITEHGPENMSAALTRTADGIERLMMK